MAARSSAIADLPTLDRRPRSAQPKPAPRVVRRRTRRQTRKTIEDRAKNAVWKRDGHCSRATGQPLMRAHIDPQRRGEVAHIDKRSTNPKQIWRLDRLVLLSAEEHQLSDPRTANAGGKVLLEIKGTNGNKALAFVRRDLRYREVWRRTTLPVKLVPDPNDEP